MAGRFTVILAVMWLLTGCARLFDPAPSYPDIVAPPVLAPASLQVVIFELESVDLPFHAGMIIRTPEGTAIFDPLGRYEPQQCIRTSDVILDPSPQDLARYLARDGVGPTGTDWTLHQFEVAVTPDVARQALALAHNNPPLPPLHCAFAVSTLLSQLPGFDFVTPDIVTADLLRALRSQPEVRYTRRSLR